MDCVRTSARSLILAVASLICSSVSSSCSCSTRDLTAFQPVSRCLRKWLRAAPRRTQSCSPNRDVASEAEVFWLENLISAGVVKNSLGMDAGFVRECTVAPEARIVTRCDDDGGNFGDRTHVIGLENGTVTCTASATRFSISRSMARLYLDLT
jgi:hypothetical protein